MPESLETRLKGKGFHKVKSDSLLNLPVRQYQYIVHLMRYLKKDFEKMQRMVSFLNYLGIEALESLKKSQQIEQIFPIYNHIDPKKTSKQTLEWLKELSQMEHPFFQYDEHNTEIIWHNKDDIEFICGRWYEVLIGALIAQHFISQNIVVDIHLGLTFQKNSDGNEMDVTFLHQGYLHLFECKTVNWHNKGKKSTTEVNNMLHKLSSVAEVGGLNSHKYFISLYDITDKSKKVAKDLDITVITGKDILNLTKKL